MVKFWQLCSWLTLPRPDALQTPYPRPIPTRTLATSLQRSAGSGPSRSGSILRRVWRRQLLKAWRTIFGTATRFCSCASQRRAWPQSGNSLRWAAQSFKKATPKSSQMKLWPISLPSRLAQLPRLATASSRTSSVTKQFPQCTT